MLSDILVKNHGNLGDGRLWFVVIPYLTEYHFYAHKYRHLIRFCYTDERVVIFGAVSSI
jgi:hypothetical protein